MFTVRFDNNFSIEYIIIIIILYLIKALNQCIETFFNEKCL